MELDMPVRGDTQTLTVTFYDVPGGTATDPTGVSLSFLLDGVETYGPYGVPPIVRDATGLYRYEWVIPLDAVLGTYTAAWTGTLPGEDAASVGYETVHVTLSPDIDPALPDFCWPVDTSCIPDWDALTDDVEPVPVYSTDVKARAIALATQTMRLLTGFRVGGCPITVRPCRAGWSDPTYRTYPVSGGQGSTPWYPVQYGGTWLNVACGAHLGGCSCTSIAEVKLYGPVGAVTQVKIDGAVLDPSAYRVDVGGLLVRTDGEPWPLGQNIAAPDTEVGTWSVTYTPGQTVDGLGAYAAGLLTREYLSACSTGKCGLPAAVTQIARGGVTMTLTPGAFPGGRTGNHIVDAYLERWNPYGHKSAPSVWSPDLHRPRRTGL